MHKLLLKTHLETGLKYLCYTQQQDHIKYTGSGKYWLRHLKKHGEKISTELLYESNLYSEFVKKAKEYSEKWNVQKNPEFANLKIEDGTGGNTVWNKRWITNGEKNIYIDNDDPVPVGWKYGRKCVFSDSSKQREFAKRARMNDTRERKSLYIERAREMGKRNRGRKRPNMSGDKSPMKRPEVREKISKGNSKQWKIMFLTGEIEIISNLYQWLKNRKLCARYDKINKIYIHSKFKAKKVND